MKITKAQIDEETKLRDDFAKHAMASLVGKWDSSKTDIAKEAYRIAD